MIMIYALNLVLGFFAWILACNFMHVDWQLALMVIRDASSGRFNLPPVLEFLVVKG
jgi:hypothetical protein